MERVKTWIKAYPKTVGTIAAALAAGLGYLGYDPSIVKALLALVGGM